MNTTTTQTKLNVSEVAALLYNLCVELGFCLSPKDFVRLLDAPPEDIDALTDAVYLAEEMDPLQSSRQIYRQVRAMIAEASRLHHKSQRKILLKDNRRGMRLFQKSKFKKRDQMQSGKLKFAVKSKRDKTS